MPLTPSQVHHPVDYARVVSRIGNEMDLTLVDLDDILPAATVMVVTVRGKAVGGGVCRTVDDILPSAAAMVVAVCVGGGGGVLCVRGVVRGDGHACVGGGEGCLVWVCAW